METETIDWSKTWSIYMYRVLLFGFIVILLSCAYMVNNEIGRISHAVISMFSESMKKNFVLTVMVSLGALMFSYIGCFFEKERFSNVLLFFSEIFALVAEMILLVVMFVVVFRINDDDVWGQLWSMALGFLGFL